MKLQNKRGDKILSVYWFAILVIVAVGVVLMVNTFYGKGYDVREVEARILAEKVADCVYFGGESNSLLLTPQGTFREDFKDNFLSFCTLNFDPGKEFVRPEYYVEVNFFPDTNLRRSSFVLSEGNLNWKPDCEEKVADRSKLATCVEKEFFMNAPGGAVYLVKILSIVGKVQENV
ncbi:MAG: hypothetical protein KKB62_02860 [Nanoarchaeota archaeon]|nr:hypothetical protein [Nanoarchaeota archaeon]